MLLASAITAAFLVAGLSAWRLLKAAADASAGKTLRFAVRLAALLVPAQIVVGDLHGLNTLEHQPAKVAAVEALWETQKGAPLTLFAVIDESEGRNHYAVEIPKALSIILTHDPDGAVRGLEEFGDDHPPVAPVFWSFRIMVAVGVLMLALSWIGLFVLRKATPRWLLWAFAAFTFSGWIATLAGWMVTEIGRQPWLVTGILRTADAVGEASDAALGASLTAYALTYAALLLSYMVVITHLAGKGSE
jgi:cytochrome d ubiquinol oxidase subunit I